MTKKIFYLIAGQRNLTEGAIKSNGGLYANFGETTRSASDRIADDDYRRKQLGGKIKILKEWEVVYPTLWSSQGGISDRDIHKQLKMNDRVRWLKSNNTEEFLFLDDAGDGKVAIEIIQNILIGLMCPDFVVSEIHKLRVEASYSHDEERQKLNEERQKLNEERRAITKETEASKNLLKDKVNYEKQKRLDLQHEFDALSQDVRKKNFRIESLENMRSQVVAKLEHANSSLAKEQKKLNYLSIFLMMVLFFSYFLNHIKANEILEKEQSLQSLSVKLKEESRLKENGRATIEKQILEVNKFYSMFAQCVIDPKSIKKEDIEIVNFAYQEMLDKKEDTIKYYQ